MTDEEVEIELVHGGGQVHRVCIGQIVEILEARALELFSIVHDDVIVRRLERALVSGLVLTGGGALLDGMKEAAESIFKMPVRIGKPALMVGQPELLANPMYATCYGLLLHALNNQHNAGFSAQEEHGVTRLLIRMKSWVADFF